MVCKRRVVRNEGKGGWPAQQEPWDGELGYYTVAEGELQKSQ